MGRSALSFKKHHRVMQLMKEPYLLALILLVFLSLLLFSAYPIYHVFKEVLVSEKGFDVTTVVKVLKSNLFIQTIMNSFKLGVISCLISTIIGFVFAFAVTRTQMIGRKFFNIMAMFPIISPPFVLALSMILLFGRNGLITNGMLGIENANVYGMTSLVVIQSMSYFPIAYLNLKGLLESIDPSLEDSASNLGASRWKVFNTITFPLVLPGVLSSFILVFIKSIEDFGNPMIIGGEFNTLATQAYLQIIGMYDLKTGSMMAASLLLPSLTAFLIYKYWVGKKSYVTVTGKPTQSSSVITEKKITIPLFVFCAGASLFVILMYSTVVLSAFIKLWGVNNTFTIDHFQTVFTLGFQPIKDTFVLALIATPISVIVGVIIAFLLSRKQFPGKKLMEVGSILLFAVPGTVVGIGYILAFNTPPIILTGTATIIVICLAFRYMSLGIEAGTNALNQVDLSLEEASKGLGAGGFTTFRKISLPLMIPAIFSGAIYTFVRSMSSISAIIFLVSAKWNLLTVSILSAVEVGRFGVATAYVVILFVIVILSLFLLSLFSKLREGKINGLF